MKNVNLILFCVILPCAAFSEPESESEKRGVTLKRDNLYTDKKGNIFLRYVELSHSENYKDKAKLLGSSFYKSSIYETTIYETEDKKTNKSTYEYRYTYKIHIYRDHFEIGGKKSKIKLKSVVNPETWRRISSRIYVDKNHVYHEHYSDFGHGLCISQVDNFSSKDMRMYYGDGWKSLKDIPDWDGKCRDEMNYMSNGESVYYRDKIIEGLKQDAFRLINSNTRIYSTNGKDIYCRDEKTTMKKYLEHAKELAKSDSKELNESARVMMDFIKEIKE